MGRYVDLKRVRACARQPVLARIAR
jgi:hypothetical protein